MISTFLESMPKIDISWKDVSRCFFLFLKQNDITIKIR